MLFTAYDYQACGIGGFHYSNSNDLLLYLRLIMFGLCSFYNNTVLATLAV